MSEVTVGFVAFVLFFGKLREKKAGEKISINTLTIKTWAATLLYESGLFSLYNPENASTKN